MERIRLLIIDEHQSVRRALETRLSTMPQLEVLGSAGSLSEIEAAINTATPDVVLIEPKHLNGKGMAVIEALTSAPQPPLIIVLTSYRDEDEELVASQLGISCYMLKEIDSQALLDTILSCHGSSGDPSGPC